MKNQKNCYIHEFSVRASSRDLAVVRKRLLIATKMYNALLGIGLMRLDSMRKDPAYKPAMDALTRLNKQLIRAERNSDKKRVGEIKRERKLHADTLTNLRKEYALSEYDLSGEATVIRNGCYFKDHIQAKISQSIVNRVWRAIAKHLFERGGRPRFKSKRQAMKSIEVNAHESLMLKLGCDKKPTRLTWQGLEMPLILLGNRDTDGYQERVLLDIENKKLKYNRVIMRTVKGKPRLYVQSVIDGLAPRKQRQVEAELNARGNTVGLDLGVSSLAVFSEKEAKLIGFVDDIKRINAKIARLQRRNSRILRLANSSNYEHKPKKRGRKTVYVWKRKKNTRDTVRTKHWLRNQAKIRELHRRLAAKRKQYHDIIANMTLSLGDLILTENVSVKGWQKLHGKSISAFAPSALIETIRRKAENAGGRVELINTWKAKLSQYNHVTDEYQKKRLSQRWAEIDGGNYQRDLYSAYLAYCIDDSRTTVDCTKAIANWSRARRLLDAASQHVHQHANRDEFFGSSAGFKRPSVEQVAA